MNSHISRKQSRATTTTTTSEAATSGRELQASPEATEGLANHPLKLGNINHTHSQEDLPSDSSHPDITRPTLKRITAEHHQKQSRKNHSPSNSINQVWLTRHSQHSPSNSTDSPTSPKQTPLAQNPIRLRSDRDVLIHQVEQDQSLPGIALSYGISLSALRKANRMWASDPLDIKTTLRIPLGLCNLPPSKRIEIEQDSGKVLVSEPHPRSSHSSSSLSTSTIHSGQHFAPSSSHSRTSTLNNSHERSNVNSEDSCQSLLDLDHSSTLSNHSSCDSYQYPQLGQLVPISNTDTPPPIPETIVGVASLENTACHQLGFFNSKAIQPNYEASSSSLSPSPSLMLPDSTRTSSSTDRIYLSSNNLRQRSRLSPSSHPSTSSSRTPTIRSPQIPSPTSPDSKRKQTFNLFSAKAIPSLTPFLHSNITHLLGNEEEAERGARTTGKSKWTTVRPGKPPPLGQALSFLEEPATLSTNKIGQAVSNAIEGIFSFSTATSVQYTHHPHERHRPMGDRSPSNRGKPGLKNLVESHEINEL